MYIWSPMVLNILRAIFSIQQSTVFKLNNLSQITNFITRTNSIEKLRTNHIRILTESRERAKPGNRSLSKENQQEIRWLQLTWTLFFIYNQSENFMWLWLLNYPSRRWYIELNNQMQPITAAIVLQFWHHLPSILTDVIKNTLVSELCHLS